MNDHSNPAVFRAKAAPAISGWTSPANLPSDEQVVALLTSCLALVRPVGLSDSNARDWLMVAAGEVAHIHTDLLTEACAEARRTCTHHGQIVPAIIKHAGPALDEARKAAERRRQWNAEMATLRHRLPEPDRWTPTEDEIEQIKRDVAQSLSADRHHA